MKSIKITHTEIIITYNTHEQATKIYDTLYPFEQKRTTITDNTLTYDIEGTNPKNIFLVVKTFIKTLPMGIRRENYTGDINDKYRERINTYITDDKIYKVTPVNGDGTLGTLDFGLEQYSKRLDFVWTREGGFFINTRGTHITDLSHTLDFDKERNFQKGSILIEIGEVKI